MTPALLVITFALFALALWLIRGRVPDRRCPSCEVDYEVLSAAGAGPNQTYDVLACPSCANTLTCVQGTRSSLAWCPACRNRALDTPSVRRPGDTLTVEVRELCLLCGHRHDYTLSTPPERPLGKVIPFPTSRMRRDVDSASEG
jgi:hypothetical protein